jgi:hypothetical protein
MRKTSNSNTLMNVNLTTNHVSANQWPIRGRLIEENESRKNLFLCPFGLLKHFSHDVILFNIFIMK